MNSILRVSLLAVFAIISATAADETLPLALWAFGDGTIDGHHAKPGETILAGQELTATNERPLRVTLDDAPGSTVIVSAGGTIRFLVVAAADKQADLVIDVDRGAVQVDLGEKRPWRELRVHGGAMEVHVVGTLFMFERVRRDQDYIAMVHGKVRVNLLGALASALGQTQSIELDGRSGLGAGPSGFGSIDSLSSRPQLSGSAAERVGLHDQGLATNGAGWGTDSALTITGGALIDAIGPTGPDNTVVNAGTGSAVGANTVVNATVDPIVNAVTSQLNQSVVESVTQGTVQQVIQTVTDVNTSTLSPLPNPPSPPH